MKKTLLLLCISWSSVLFAQPQEVKSIISQVTVYQQGATVERTASVNLTPGRHQIMFTDLPEDLNPQRIQFQVPDGWKVLDQQYRLLLPEETKKTSFSTREEVIKQRMYALEDLEDQIRLIQKELNFIDLNEDLKANKALTVTQLREANTYFSQRRELLYAQQRKLVRERSELQQAIQQLKSALAQDRQKEMKPIKAYVIDLSVKKQGTEELTLIYYSDMAGWTSRYSLRMEELNRPLELEHYAEIDQQTGEDWKDVKLVLSTGQPELGGKLPDIQPWYLNLSSRYYPHVLPRGPLHSTRGSGTLYGRVISYDGLAVPFATITVSKNSNVIGTLTTDESGSYQVGNVPAGVVDVLFSSLGFDNHLVSGVSVPKNRAVNVSPTLQPEVLELAGVEIASTPERSIPLTTGVYQSDEGQDTYIRGSRDGVENYYIDGVKVRGSVNPNLFEDHQLTTQTYSINEKFSIPSTGNPRSTLIRTVNLPANYKHKAAPALDPSVFLFAEVTDWRSFNLLEGPVSIYTQGSYMGEFFFDPANAKDTLELSLGRDAGVTVVREPVALNTSRNFFGSTITRNFAYRNRVSSSKKFPVTLLLTEQIPVSQNEKIEVSQVQVGSGKLNHETGFVEWTLKMDPQQTQNVEYSFEVKHPKDWNLNLPR